MNTFSLVQRALDASALDASKEGLDWKTVETGRILAAVQTVVDVLAPSDGGRYIVALADISTAATALGERRIIVSSKPLRDHGLSIVEKAVVLATFTAHEIGHTIITAPRKGLVKERNAHSGYHAVCNLGDDIILEPFMVDRFPILEDAFDFTGQWVLRSTATELPKVQRMHRKMTTPERFNVILNGSRYGDIADIVWADEASVLERDWSRDWARRLIATPLTAHDAYFDLVDECWERIRSEPDVEEEEPETGTEPGTEPGEGEDGDPGPEGEPGPGREPEPGEQSGGEDWDDDDTDDGDEPGEGDGDGSDGDGDTDDTTDGDDGDGDADGDDVRDPWDEDTDKDGDESDGTDGSGSDEEFGDDSDETGDEPGGDPIETDGDTESIPDDASGGGGNPDTDHGLRPEDDFDEDEVDENTHTQSESDGADAADEEAETRIREYESTNVTTFGRHGSISTTWS